MSEGHCEGPLSPWNDVNVKSALKAGRDTSDIYLLDCPSCGAAGYYNQGSHFTCGACGAGYACITEEEEPPCDRQYIILGEEYTLEDWDSEPAIGQVWDPGDDDEV